MIKLLVDKLPRITKNKKKLEKALNVKIINRGKEVFLDGSGEDEYIAEKVINALDFGFPFSTALLIKEQDNLFEIISIKAHTKRKDLASIRSRIIGKNGKTLSTLTHLTKCNFELKDNEVGIIGNPEHIYNAQEAMIRLIKGSKQANIYAYLEKHQVQPVEDLGLKE
ncbi:MAG: hypothetical protein KKB31_03170 [Nanoarchaeota archaeon]|nr:hypothetical protein [Nanoarchaeota archaeon]